MSSPQDEIDALRAQIAALTARVYQLEQKAGVAAEVRQPVVPQAPPQATAPSPRPSGQMPPPQPPMLPSTPSSANAGIEKRIGQYWLNRIGIVAILIGVSYFLKYAFENNWIGPAGRVAIGLLAGIGLLVWSERFRSRGYQFFSYSLKAIGIGTLYLSLWGAFQVYHLIPAAAAFLAMVIVTGATITLALTQNAELLATFALAGGFATPVLLSTGENHEVVLFSYVALLDLAILATAIARPWRRLLWGSVAGTIILYAGWFSDYYTQEQRPLTIFFAALFAAIFASIPLLTPHDRSKRFAGPSITLTVLPLLSAGAFFLALWTMYEPETATLTWYALALAAVYLGIARSFGRRFPDRDTKFIALLHVAIAVAFITIAIPLKLDGHWITIGWLIESAVLLWVGVRTQSKFLRYLAIAALTLGIFRLLMLDNYQTETLVFNARFATYLVAIAVLGGIVIFGKTYASKEEMPFLDVALVLLNLLALIALTREASDYFDRQLVASHLGRLGFAGGAQLRIARDFSYSAIWLIYGAGLMAWGFWKRSAFTRWQALVLIAVTIVKVFLYDTSQLQQGYRILSFVALGAVLLAISFIYQRDWLKLSSSSAKKSADGH
ncbi:MAG: DUF2339 domain-containing protein [Candidatus Acidiferrales bacterium]